MSEKDSAPQTPAAPPPKPEPPPTTKIKADRNIGDKLPPTTNLPPAPVKIIPPVAPPKK